MSRSPLACERLRRLIVDRLGVEKTSLMERPQSTLSALVVQGLQGSGFGAHQSE
jgi:hypothetical protein